MMTFAQLQQLVERATQSGAAPFYRKLYGMGSEDGAKKVGSLEEWRALPLFTKADMIATPIEERTFVPWSDLLSVEATSGTSGNPPVFIPWTPEGHGYGYRSRYIDSVGPVLSSSAASVLHERIAGTLVVIDPKQPSLTVRLAAAAGVTAIVAYVYQLLPIADEMERQGIAKNIRFIEYYGESLTKESLRVLTEKFPNAIIASEYGSLDVELSPIGVSCLPRARGWEYEKYDGTDLLYYELLDSESGKLLPISPGVEGELVISGYNAAFPLIRYRIGDTVRVLNERCARHGEWSFRVLGRTAGDFLKIPGGLLRVDEIERALGALGNTAPDTFQLVVHAVEPKVSVTLKIRGRDEASMEEFARRVEKELRVGPAVYYREGIEKGLYAPLNCAPLPPDDFIVKRKRMVRET